MAKQQDPRLLNPRIEALPTTRIAFVRHDGPQKTIEKTFKRFIEWCGDRGLLTPGTKYIGVAHDNVVASGPNEPRYDCAITVGRDFRPEGDVEVATLEAGEYAIVTYQGPYWGVDAAYSWLEDHPPHGVLVEGSEPRLQDQDQREPGDAGRGVGEPLPPGASGSVRLRPDDTERVPECLAGLQRRRL